MSNRRNTSQTIANSTITSSTWVPFLDSKSRHLRMWLSGTSPSAVYFTHDYQATAATTANAQLTPGTIYEYDSSDGLGGVWVLSAGSVGNLNLSAY